MVQLSITSRSVCVVRCVGVALGLGVGVCECVWVCILARAREDALNFRALRSV